MPYAEAVVVYRGHGITTRIRSLSAAAISVTGSILPATGENVTVFIDGVGRFDSRVAEVRPPRIDLEFLTDTRERWKRLQALRRYLVPS